MQKHQNLNRRDYKARDPLLPAQLLWQFDPHLGFLDKDHFLTIKEPDIPEHFNTHVSPHAQESGFWIHRPGHTHQFFKATNHLAAVTKLVIIPAVQDNTITTHNGCLRIKNTGMA